jgi:putative phosphoesterase
MAHILPCRDIDERGAMPIARERFLPAEIGAGRLAACFGLVSDTHMPERCAELPTALFDALRGVDLLLHAGDVGELWVLDRLSAIAPVVAVHGNDETAEATRELPYQQPIGVAGRRLLLCHTHHPDRAEELAARRDDAWAPKLARRAALGRRAGAAVVVFGHTHVPLAREQGGVLLVNPGAIASPGAVARQVRRTVALLFIRDDGAPFAVHLDLAAPDRPFAPEIAWDAGFRAAHDRFVASLLDADLATDWPRLTARYETLPGELRDALRAATLRVARRCWAGEQATIGRADLLAEARRHPGLSAPVRARLEPLLARENE